MFRIRFHGRGGQGMKTASRIVGTAAFRQGYYAQDSPEGSGANAETNRWPAIMAR
jgi:Pyruvate/2-oxoacid:ferredoxin oxidoreductase gamma subunit